MEWMAVIGNSIQYIEAHITEPLTIETIARAVNVSPFYFQKGLPCCAASRFRSTSAIVDSRWPETTLRRPTKR